MVGSREQLISQALSACCLLRLNEALATGAIAPERASGGSSWKLRARGWEQSTDSPDTWAQALKPLLPCFTCSNFFPAMGLNFLICKMRIIVVITTPLGPFGCYSTWCWGHAWCSMDGSCGYYYLGHPSWFCLVSATSQKLPRLLILRCLLSVNFCKVYCFSLSCNSDQE